MKVKKVARPVTLENVEDYTPTPATRTHSHHALNTLI